MSYSISARGRSIVRTYHKVALVINLDNEQHTYASYGVGTHETCANRADSWEKAQREFPALILWVLASFGSIEAFNDLCTHLSRLIKSGLRRFGKFTEDSVQNVLTDIWMIMSGNKPTSKSYDHAKSGLSTWVNTRCRLEISNKKRWSHRLLTGLDRALDGQEEDLDCIGNEDLGLTFESADPDTVDKKVDKWICLDSFADLSVEDYGRRESIDHGLKLDKLRQRIGEDNWKVLRLYFIDTKKKINRDGQEVFDENGQPVFVPLSIEDVGNVLGITKMGAQKKILRTINEVRRMRLGNRCEPLVSLGGRKRQAKLVDLKVRKREFAPEGELLVVDKMTDNSFRSPFGSHVCMPNRPQERLRTALANGISPKFADYVRKIRGEGFVMYSAD